MAEVTYADPTTTRTPLNFDVLPPIQQAAPISTRQPLNVQQNAPGQLARPIDYHAQPKYTPSIQQQIIEDGANWKTIDIKPNNTSVPSPKTNSTSASVLAGTNVVSGNTFAQEQALESAAYYGGWALSGFWDGAIEGKNYPNEQLRLKRDPAEDSAYTIGQKVGQEIRDLGKDGVNGLKDLWDKKPHFEIPTIQIPKFNIPGMPDFSIPKIPEFDIPKLPEIKFPGLPEPRIPEPQSKPQPTTKEKDIPRPTKPKPKPIPRTPEQQLRQLELDSCGSISFWVGYAVKVLGTRWVPNAENTGGYVERIEVESTPEIAYSVYKKWNPDGYQKIDFFLRSGGGSGSYQIKTLSEFSSYEIADTGGSLVNEDGTEIGGVGGQLTYPYYYAFSSVVEVRGITTKTAIGAILDDLSSSRTPLIFDVSVSDPNAKGCPYGNPHPTFEPPPDPPEDCDCAMTCCPEIDYRKIQAIIAEEVKKLDVTAAIPLSFQIRHEGDTPQMVIQCAERKSAASGNQAAKYGSAMYPITVPHWKGGQNDKPRLPPYKKGNWEGILVLADNSKVTINAQNESECIKILNAIKPWIDNKMLENSYFKGGKIKPKIPIKETQVYPRYGRYFANGQKNNKPDWRVDFS